MARIFRASLVLLGSTLLAGAAGAAEETRYTYGYVGQGGHFQSMPAPQERQQQPYALSGRAAVSDKRDDRFWERQPIRFIDVGQGRVLVPAGR